MNLKQRVYYYTIGKKSKKGLLRIAIILSIFLVLIPTGISAYDNVINNFNAPSYLQVGDLLFCDIDLDFINKIQSIGIDVPYIYTAEGISNDHIAMYIGNNNFIEASPYHLNSENGKLYGVITSSMGLLKLWGKNIRYAKIADATPEQKENAVKWALTQLGQPYQSDYINKNSDPYDETDKYSDEWYCTELIWAAYEKQGIDLAENSAEVVTIDQIKENKQVVFYEQGVIENSKVNLDLSLAIMCFLDLQSNKQNL